MRTYFLYDGVDPVCELNSSGVVTAANTFGTNGLLSRHTSTGSTFYTFDSAGSVAQRLDSGQNVLSTPVFDSTGSTLGGGSTDPFGFGARFGYYSDSETGLQLLRRRYYGPGQARFLNRDPAGYSAGMNLYAYSENAGPNGVDPSGMAVYRLWCGVGPFFNWYYAHVMLKMTGECNGCTSTHYASFYGTNEPFLLSHGSVDFGAPEDKTYQQNDPHDQKQYCKPELISDDPDLEQLLCNCIAKSAANPPLYTVGYMCGQWAKTEIDCAKDHWDKSHDNPFAEFGGVR